MKYYDINYTILGASYTMRVMALSKQDASYHLTYAMNQKDLDKFMYKIISIEPSL